MAEPPAIAFERLLARLPPGTCVVGDASRRVASVETDSRAVRAGALFVALRGERADGHAFVEQAMANGAVAVVAERPLEPRAGVAVATVPDARRALSALAAAFYGDPSHALDVIGVTGTNGKTTTVQMVRAILDEAGRPCGTIGTIGAAFGARRWKPANTTPPPPELHALLAQMRDAGAAAVALEVSSHALALARVDDVHFRVAALTNVTRDHLDFHATLDAYAAAKRRLFGMARACVINAGDPYGRRWARELRSSGVATTEYAERGARLSPSDVSESAEGSRFRVDGRAFALCLPGRFNVRNALAAIGVARSLGIDDAVSARGLARLDRVPGRMERVGDGGVDVVIDYAHTPDALENALRTLRATAAGAVTVVFGCGGDRDRGKRPEMGAIAARFADRVYVTSDNPRTEDPQAIADEIVAGMRGCEYVVELDRRAAIERAVTQARTGDVVLVAGKGHETLQIVGHEALEFDDAAAARNALRLRGALR